MTSPLRLLAAPSYVLLIGLVCSVAVALNLARLTADKAQDRFAFAVEQTQDRLESRIDTYVGMLEAGAAMLAAVDLDLSQAEFRAFAQRLNLAQRYPGVQGVGYSMRIRRNAGPLTADMMRAQGAADFRFWPEGLDEGGERHAILYLEPMDERNRAAIGFNMMSEPVRRAAMERARDSGRPAASGTVELVQEITADRQAGFLVYVPVYEGGDPGDLEARRQLLAGYVYSPFRAGDMMEGIFAGAPDTGLAVELYDGPPGAGTLMHRSGVASSAARDAGFVAARTLDVAGRAWTAVYSVRSDFDFGATPNLAFLVFLSGILVTLVLAALAWWQARTNAVARRHAADLQSLNVLMQGEIDHRKLLLDELNHRVKNTLATVQSMAAQTLRGSESLPAFHEAFESRLIALSSTHNLLTRGAWRGAALRDLLDAELAPYERDDAARVTISGPDVELRPAEATSLGMAFHELTTNAVKYGALSRPEGRVSVAWELAEQGGRERLRIDWRETGGPAVTPPKRRGFGSRLIERGLVGQHEGEARLSFEPEGVSCHIEITLGRAADAPGPAGA